MTEARRRAACERLRELLDEGMHRKLAFRTVIDEIKAQNPELPASRSQLYAWCARFGVSLA